MKTRMLAVAAIVMGLGILAPASAPRAWADPPDDGTGLPWFLIWSDEFNGAYGEMSNSWGNCPLDGCFPPPQRLAFWTGSPYARVNGDGSMLETIGNCPGPANCNPGYGYVGGFARSKVQFQYGYFEMRLTDGFLKDGSHPVFWLLRESSDGTTGEFEIDIAEFNTSDDDTRKVLDQNVYWDYYNGAKHTQKDHPQGLNWIQGPHTFGVLWAADKVHFYIDGAPAHPNPLTYPTIVVPNVPMAIRLTMQVGPTNYTGPIDANVSQSWWETDYVKVWQHCSGCDCAISPVQ